MSAAVSKFSAERQTIESIVGRDCVLDAGPSDAVDGVAPLWMIEPRSAEQVSAILALADHCGFCIIPRGGGSKIDWGNPPRRVDILLSTLRLNRILEHAAGDMTATVEAGCTLTQLDTALAERGQRLALDPLWPDRATVGGILASNDSGALRLAYGTLRDHLIGVTVALADGTLARSGGKVVKNVAGYDLPKLFTGSMGTLGVIVEATFRLYPVAKAATTLCFVASTSDALNRALAAMAACSLITSAVQIEAAQDGAIVVEALVEGLPESIESKSRRVAAAMTSSGAQRVTNANDSSADGAPLSSDNQWGARERLFSIPNACTAKFNLLPTQIAGFIDHVRSVGDRSNIPWRMVIQSVGVGLICLHGSESARVLAALADLRTQLGRLSGSLTVLRCPPTVKAGMNVWPDVGSALPLMREIKKQFDPRGTLSPGRFVGGI